MKRSLVMLLVVALLAMMIPSFALADDTPTLTLSGTSATAYLQSWNYSTDLGITFTTNWEGTGYNSGYVRVYSSDDSVIDTDDSDPKDCYDGQDPESIPYVTVCGEGKATVTVQMTSYSGVYFDSKEFTVEVKKAKTEKIELDTSRPVSDFEMTLDDDYKSLPYYFIVTPAEAYYGHNFKWSIDDPTIARIDKWGYLYPLKAGTVTVTATAKDNADAKATAKITIKEGKKKEEEKAPTLSFSTSTFTLKTSDYMELNDYLLVENPVKNDTIIWTSSDPKIVSISDQDYGSLSLHKPGTATITARSKKFPDAKAQCTVTVEKEPLKSITFSNPPATINDADGAVSLWNYVNTDPVYYADYWNEFGWTSSDPQVAYVDADGDVTGIKAGTATITVYNKDDESKKASFDLTVKDVPVTDIVFSKSEYTVKTGGSYTMNYNTNRDYRLLPTNHSNTYTSRWTSSDEDVVTVNGGYITGVSVGAATVTLSIRNSDDTVVEKSVKVTVTDNALTGIAFKKDAYTVPLSNRQNEKEVYLKVTPADADFDVYDLYADSSDPQVATARIIDYSADKGLLKVELRALKPGTTIISVLSHSNAALSATTTVTVKPVLLTSVAMQAAKKTVNLYEGTLVRSVTINANIKPSDAYCTAIWETTDAGVAYVIDDEDNDGRSAELVAVGPGTCDIVLTATDGTNTMTATMTVTVKRAKVAKLILNKTKATGYIIKGGENTLQLTATDSKTEEPIPVTWKSSNTKVAKVDANGLVTFVAAGKAKITATTKDGNGTTATCKLIVKKLAVTAVKPAKKALTMEVGEEQTLKVTVKPAKAYNPALTFKSSKPKIVSVDKEGNVKAHAVGKAVITIKAQDGSKKAAKVTITVKAATKNNDGMDIGDGIDLTIDGDVLDGLDGIDDLDIGGDAMDIDNTVTNVTIE